MAMRGAEERMDGVARERLRMAARGIVVEAIAVDMSDLVRRKI